MSQLVNMSGNENLQVTTRFFFILMILNILLLVGASILLNDHIKEEGDLKVLLQTDLIIKSLIIADKESRLDQKIASLKKIPGWDFQLAFSNDKPKGFIREDTNDDGFLSKKELYQYINTVGQQDVIKVATALDHGQFRWVTVSKQRQIFWRDKQAFFIIVIGIVVPLISLMILFLSLLSVRKKGLMRNITRSLLDQQVEKRKDPEIEELKMLVEKAFKEKVFLMSSMAHDINTAIFRLRLKLRLNEKIEQMEREIEYVHSIIKSSFVIARSSGVAIKLTAVDLESLVESFMDQFYPNPNQIVFIPSASVSIVNAEVTLLYRLIHNTIDNALKHAERLILTTKSLGDYAYIIFQDNGPGIPDDEIPRLMRPFEQLHNRQLGIGLGFAIMSHLASLQNAKLFVRNRRGASGLNIIFAFKKVVDAR